MEEKRLMYMAQGHTNVWISARERQIEREERTARKAELNALMMLVGGFLGGMICGMAAYHAFFFLGVI